MVHLLTLDVQPAMVVQFWYSIRPDGSLRLNQRFILNATYEQLGTLLFTPSYRLCRLIDVFLVESSFWVGARLTFVFELLFEGAAVLWVVLRFALISMSLLALMLVLRQTNKQLVSTPPYCWVNSSSSCLCQQTA